ncbi:unnamed protein product [Rhizopus stolonifer]
MANSSSVLPNPSLSSANFPGMDIDYDGDSPDYSNYTTYFDFNQSRTIESFGNLPVNENYYLIEEDENKDENGLGSEDEAQPSNDDSIELSAVVESNSGSDASERSSHDEPQRSQED